MAQKRWRVVVDVFGTVTLKAVHRYASSVLGPKLISLLAIPTLCWKHEPGFSFKVSARKDRVILRVFTDSVIYTWVNWGTEPHLIAPNPSLRLARGQKTLIRVGKRWKERKLRLRMRERFKPSTLPGRLTSRPTRSGGEWVFAKKTIQGIEPRHFVRTALKELLPDMMNDLAGVVRAALQEEEKPSVVRLRLA